MICSSVEEDVVASHARRAAAATSAATSAATATAAAAGEPLRPLAPADDMLSSVRSSLASNASVTDLKRDQHPGLFMHTSHHATAGSSASSSPSTTRSTGGHTRASAPSARAHGMAPSSASTTSNSSRSKRARFENKIRLLAQYMKTLSMGLSHRPHRAPPATVGSHSQQHPQQQRGPVPQMVKRRSQVSLSQYSLPRSAPDVLDPNKSARSLLNGSAEPSRDAAATAAATRNSSSSQQTALSWDEIIAGAVFVEENEVMPASPRSRKRGRPCSELFEDGVLRRLLKQCGVPAENMDEVVKMVYSQFGTCQLDLTVLHELVGGNSVVVIGMLVFSCIDCGEELLDLHSLPAFLLHIQSRYDPKNPFHNACHAADVLHSFFMALWMSELGGRIAVHNQIGALFAAIMHDIDHIGLSNDFLLKTNHAIAAKYPTRAPMEEMHAAVALDLLTDNKYNVLAKLCNDQLEQVMKIVRETIQSTALCYQKELIRDVAAVSPSEWDVATLDVLPLHIQVVALRCVMHVSDISQTMKPFAIHQKWVLRLNEEQFMQGDLDAKMQLAVCPDSFYRHKWSQDAFLSSQIWFLENMALPAAKSFNSIPLLHLPPLEANLQANIAQWRAQLSGQANP